MDEALPDRARAGTADADAGEDEAEPTGEDRLEEPAELSRGAFRSLEHSTGGAAVILELADGSRFLCLEDLEPSNGPDLRMWLTEQEPSDD